MDDHFRRPINVLKTWAIGTVEYDCGLSILLIVRHAILPGQGIIAQGKSHWILAS
jgi:hypothetical protein